MKQAARQAAKQHADYSAIKKAAEPSDAEKPQIYFDKQPGPDWPNGCWTCGFANGDWYFGATPGDAFAAFEAGTAAGATAPKLYGVTWYGSRSAIAQTGYVHTADEARRIAVAGAEAPDFQAWADAQPFSVDGMADADDPKPQAIMRADVETEEHDGEFQAWPVVAS